MIKKGIRNYDAELAEYKLKVNNPKGFNKHKKDLVKLEVVVLPAPTRDRIREAYRRFAKIKREYLSASSEYHRMLSQFLELDKIDKEVDGVRE